MTHTRPGGLVIIDSDRPFELSFSDRLEQLCLTIPKTLVDPRLNHQQSLEMAFQVVQLMRGV